MEAIVFQLDKFALQREESNRGGHTIRKILFATVAIAAFVFVTATPQQAKASWLSEYVHQRLDPSYGRSAYVPGYDYYAPGYNYTPRYYTVPSYRYSFAPSYLP